MNTILVPLDGSTLAEQILPYARALAPLLNAQLRLLEIVPEPAPELVSSAGLTLLYAAGDALDRQQSRQRWELEEAFARSETYIAAQTSRLEDADLAVQSDILAGQPAPMIVELAREPHTKLVAMATHGRGGLQRWALGSVADRVAQASPAPVLLVRATHQVPVDFSLKHILVPLDGSELARQALPLACELAQAAHAKITLLQAVSPKLEGYPSLLTQPLPSYGVIVNALRIAAQQELEQVAGQIRQPDIPIEIAVVTGHAAEAIVDEAAKRAAGMIVMATHGYGGLRRWALGSVADQVLHATDLPLILVRAH